MQKKKGVSLIVLVITIIVMIILASTIMVSLSNTGILDKAEQAVEKSNLQEIKNMVALKWAELYGKDEITIKSEILKMLTDAKIDVTKYKLDVTSTGASITPGASWVVSIVDGVPIPKGFAMSPLETERKKDKGFVIYELAPNEKAIPSNETYRTTISTRNQYVWVPVDDFSKFVRQNFGQSYKMSNVLGTAYNDVGQNYWEVVLDTKTNMPSATQNSKYVTAKTLAEVQEMYESVKTYGGFYIARYEAGLDVGNHRTTDDGKITTPVYSAHGKAPYNYVRWAKNMSDETGGAVEISRSIYPKTNTNYGVVSTLTYGVQWDRTLAWWLETKPYNATGDVMITTEASLNVSRNYGNYLSNRITQLDSFAQYLLYSGGKLATTYAPVGPEKSLTEAWLLTTGATAEAEINNIYDMAGNLLEWTMEGNNAAAGGINYHVLRGGHYNNNGTADPVTYRSNNFGNENYGAAHYGFRPSLYIKK